MKINESILQGYENSTLVNYKDGLSLPHTVAYDDLPSANVSGVLKASYRVDGKLVQTYTEQENHVGVIAGTRLGKTTSHVIPTILSMARQKVKRSLIISDPKGELYKYTADTLKRQGYKIKLLNFRDYKHSECWNMLTPIFRKYQRVIKIFDEVTVVDTKHGVRNAFDGKIYDDQNELTQDLERTIQMLTDDVGNDIDGVASMFLEGIENDRDPYWALSAVEAIKSFIWAMLEDSDPERCSNPITEETFSFSTILSILNNFKDDTSTRYNDGGYFTNRPLESRAYQLAKNTFIENAPVTRKCIMSNFNQKMAIFRESAMRLITSCTSFEFSELTEGPVAIFINYRDELKVHYQVISLFIQDAYRYLIEQANQKKNGKLDVPVYFILDEFGNFPAIKAFDTTISACAGRNIFFMLIIQSYAQLNNVYGKAVAEIIRDNLNVHVFFGSNNPATLEEFSRECGQKTRISPLSALNGSGENIEHYQMETIPLVPTSMLSHFAPGECIVTEANCGYVLFSKLERYYLSDEFKNLTLTDVKKYHCSVNVFDQKYCYKYKPSTRKKFDFDF